MKNRKLWKDLKILLSKVYFVLGVKDINEKC